MRIMEIAETGGNPEKTQGDGEITLDEVPALLLLLSGRVEHQDLYLHEIHRMLSEMHKVFTEHLPAIRSAAALADPGAAVRAYLHLPAKKTRKPAGGLRGVLRGQRPPVMPGQRVRS